jgi:hypothetical protein
VDQYTDHGRRCYNRLLFEWANALGLPPGESESSVAFDYNVIGEIERLRNFHVYYHGHWSPEAKRVPIHPMALLSALPFGDIIPERRHMDDWDEGMPLERFGDGKIQWQGTDYFRRIVQKL